MKKRSQSLLLLGATCCVFACRPLVAANAVSNTTTHASFATVAEALAALDADGQTLVLAPGIYTEPELDIFWAVTLKGADAATTIVQPAPAPGTAENRVALVDIPAEFGVTLPVVFDGLTLRFGNVAGNGGGLAVLEGSVVVRDCVVAGNAATGAGGGLFCMSGENASLAVEGTTVSGNSAGGAGGGAIRAVCTNSAFADNAASHGGGAAYSVLSECTVIGNTAVQQGGGLYGGSADRCRVIGNDSLYGGGAAGAALVNALVVSNTASQSGGGLYLGALTNGTVVGNSAATAGGGICGGAAVNALFDGNTAPLGGDYDAGALLAYCRAEPLAPGAGNLAAPPLFRDAAAGDYRLTPNSLCIDAGLTAAAPPGTDLTGALRVQGIAVDIGAYEQTPVPRVATPVVTPPSGTEFEETLEVTITCATPAAAVRYTLDGTDPTDADTLYTEPFILSQSATVRARGFKAECVDSFVATSHYVRLSRVGTPVITPASGTAFTNVVTVTITCPTNGATIRYTLDGSDPTAADTLYTEPFILAQSATIKARAFHAGMLDSAVATAAYTRLAQVGTPVFDPPSGTLFTDPLDVTITCPTNGATIRYTLDGSEPTPASALYDGPIPLTQTTVIKAVASRDGMVDSAVASATYTWRARVATPVLSPGTGTVFSEPIAVTITCGTAGAAVRYTLDGSDPTAGSALYGGPVPLAASATVKARAFKDGMADSAVATAGYTFIARVATPVCSPADGAVFTNGLTATLACATPGAEVRYTLDGSDPTAASALYTDPLFLTQSAVLRARAFKDGMADSFTAAATYTRLAKVGTPVFAPASGTVFTNALDVTITCPTNGAAIHYTLDGSDPTADSTLYEGAFSLTQSATLKARAFKDGLVDSDPAEAAYTRAVTFSDAVDAPALGFVSGGHAPWFVQADEVHVGTHAVRSGVITNRETTWMETTVSGAGTLRFWWKVSCEDDELLDDWDYLGVTVDGAERGRIDGESGWAEVVLALADAGPHTVRWTYVKDRVISEGRDCAWLDAVVWTPASAETQTTPVPVPYAWLDGYGLPAGGDYEASAFADVDGDGHKAWQEYVAGTCPTNRQSVFRTSIRLENGKPLIGWTPDLGAERSYTVSGKAALRDAAWATPTNAASRFFRVDVSMPSP